MSHRWQAKNVCCSQPRTLVPASHGFVVGKDLVRQLVDKLIKAQVHLGTGKQERQWYVPSFSTAAQMAVRGQLGSIAYCGARYFE